MITGVHALIYSRHGEAVRRFFAEVLQQPSVDASMGGDPWPIYAMPPAELAVHPTDGDAHHELYLLCDDIQATIADLATKGITCGEVTDRGWGLVTTVELAEGEQLGLYEPRHPLAHGTADALGRDRAID
jgi:hypothetical protein